MRLSSGRFFLSPDDPDRQRLPCARHYDADPEAHDLHVLDDRALADLDRRRASARQANVPRLDRSRLLDPVADHEAALSATCLDAAAGRNRAPSRAASGSRVARQMVDARRTRAGADDLFHQEPGRLRRVEPQRRLFLHRRRRADDPVLRLDPNRRHGGRAPARTGPAGAGRRTGREYRRLAQFRAELSDHSCHGILRARHHSADDPLHDGLRLDERAFDPDDHVRAVRKQGVLPVRRRVRRVSYSSRS